MMLSDLFLIFFPLTPCSLFCKVSTVIVYLCVCVCVTGKALDRLAHERLSLEVGHWVRKDIGWPFFPISLSILIIFVLG